MDIKLKLQRVETAKLHKRPSKCTGCPGNPSTPGWNPLLFGGFAKPYLLPKPKLVFVGIAPGEEEENAGEPFVGPSGRRLKRAVSLGAERTPIPCSKINLFNCRTIKVGFRGQIVNRDPTAREIKECWKRWLGPLLLSTDAIVVPLGTLAYKYIVEKPLEKHDGTTIKFGHALGHRLIVPRRIWQ